MYIMVLGVVDWVVSHLETKGWIVWRSDKEEQARLVALHRMYPGMIIVSVKAQLRGNKTVETAISQSEYKKLLEFCGSCPVWVMFIDAFERCIYSFDLNRYKDQVRQVKDKVYLHLNNMKYVRDLTLHELRELEEVPPRYAHVKRFFER